MNSTSRIVIASFLLGIFCSLIFPQPQAMIFAGLAGGIYGILEGLMNEL